MDPASRAWRGQAYREARRRGIPCGCPGMAARMSGDEQPPAAIEARCALDNRSQIQGDLDGY